MVIKHQDHGARRTPTTGNPRYLPVDIESTYQIRLTFKVTAAVPTTMLAIGFLSYITLRASLRGIFLTDDIDLGWRSVQVRCKDGLLLSGIAFKTNHPEYSVQSAQWYAVE